MIEQGLFQKKIVGRDGFIWWIGQIASDSWKMNVIGSLPPKDAPSLAEDPGFSERYQVRIMGYHTADPKALSDDDLPWAGVMYPVTGGAHSGSSGSTANLREGNFVYGFFLDGEDAQQPVIMGALGYSQYTSIYKSNPKIKPFVPFLGYSKAPRNSVRTNKARIAELANPAQPGIKPVSTRISQGPGSSSSTETAEDAQQAKDGSIEKPLASPYSCPKGKQGVNGVQKTVKNLIQDVENAKAGLKDFKKSIISPTWSQIDGKQVDIDAYIEIKMQRASKAISGFISDKIKAVQKWIEKKIESALLKVYSFLYPPQQQQVGDVTRTAMDILQCLFRKMINNLAKMIYQSLTGIIDKYVNVPICAAENIVAAILGKLFGLINGIVGQVMGLIDGVLGAVGQALDIVGDVFQFLDDILDFLLCKEEPQCPEVEDWAIWLGSEPESTTLDARNLINKIKGFAGTVSDVVDPDNFDFDTDLDFSNIVDEAFDNCDTNPIQCGPPRAVFWGGSGSGASGNVIVSAIGDILGVDIINSGTGYDNRPPFLTFKDDCGNGNGGSGTVVTGPVSEGDSGEWFSDPDGTEIGVIGVNINDPGFGYIPVPNGSKGGDGRTWSDYDQTTVVHPGGDWDDPWDPGEVIPVGPGDTVNTPIGTQTVVYCMNGDTHDVFGGSNHIVKCEGVLTAPAAEETAVPGGQYPAILYICEVDIIDPGFDYEPGDKVVITPDVGAEITPTFGPFGNLIKLEIINGGEGFTEFPTITIESETGFNAEIRARLCIDRITDELKLPGVQDKVVSVVDCVGKI